MSINLARLAYIANQIVHMYTNVWVLHQYVQSIYILLRDWLILRPKSAINLCYNNCIPLKINFKFNLLQWTNIKIRHLSDYLIICKIALNDHHWLIKQRLHLLCREKANCFKCLLITPSQIDYTSVCHNDYSKYDHEHRYHIILILSFCPKPRFSVGQFCWNPINVETF